MLLKFPGSGRGFLATFKLLSWHMLSYDKMIFLDSWVILANAESIHTNTIRNTCAGPSDLDSDNDIRTKHMTSNLKSEVLF